MNIVSVSPMEFKRRLDLARLTSKRVKTNCVRSRDLPYGVRYYMHEDRKSGCGVSQYGELVALFSLVPKQRRGDDLVAYALTRGASHLNCYDGHLPAFYEKHGFEEVGRESNWECGAPDVVFMKHSSIQVV